MRSIHVEVRGSELKRAGAPALPPALVTLLHIWHEAVPHL
jgi:hypothetical protein